MTRKGINEIVGDWRLLAFLILFMDVKIICKLLALLLIYVLSPDLRLGLKLRASRLPLFYIGMIGIAILDWLRYGLYAQHRYNISLAFGLASWICCLLAVHQVKLSIEGSDTAAVHRTLKMFFVLNAIVSYLMLARIMIHTGTLNPYTYQGNHQEYFLGTGDYIRGLSFDMSGTNALINAFGVLYFLYRRQTAMVLVCMSVLVLTGSNATIALTLLALLWPFFFRSSRERKSLIVICCFLVILFTVELSPQNRVYAVAETAKTLKDGKAGQKVAANQPVPRITDMPDSLLDPEQRKLKIATQFLDSVGYVFWKYKDSIYRARGSAPSDIRRLPKPNINGPEYQAREDTSSTTEKLRQFGKDIGISGRADSIGRSCCKVPGKIVALMQTVHFMKSAPEKLLTGDGLGMLSSKQAFRATALGIAGQYPVRWRFFNSDFRDLHFALYLFYFTRGLELRSMLNAPDNVYDQLLAEYGLAGLILFAVWYVGFFVRHLRRLTYGIPLLFLMLAGFFTGYWFEQLSVVVLFECMILLDIKEGGRV